MSKPILWIVIPCYNEEQVLPITAPMFLKKINDLAAAGLISEKSRVLFVNDGSRDATWSLIQKFASEDEHFIGISQSRNRGHQNAVLAGLMEALHSGSCDITISIDCDGQDDINAMDEMVKKYLDGAEVVYGVRSRRDTDTFFKRFTAEGFYHVMNALGADIVFNHADYRLISTRVLESFADYREVNIFLRGMVPLVGYPSDTVYYERHERLAGESHYPLSKMLALAFDGITSLSNKPIRLITGAGIVVSLISFIGVIWAIVQAVLGSAVAGWASTICIVCFMGGVQLVCLGGIGSASRVVELDGKQYTIGALVLSNHAVFDDLVVAGTPIQSLLDAHIPPHEDKGSIITVLATDIPLSERQLRRFCHRALVGLSRTGSFCGNGSGEIVIAFTTANRVPHYSEKAILPMGMLHDDAINPLFRAVAECVEESVLSSLLHAETVTGHHGRTVRCLSDLLK